MIAFPKKVVLPDKQVTVQSPEEFLAYYDEIFTADYRERIGQLMAEDDVWWSYRGVAVGNGEVWLNERDGTLWIEAPEQWGRPCRPISGEYGDSGRIRGTGAAGSKTEGERQE